MKADIRLLSPNSVRPLRAKKLIILRLFDAYIALLMPGIIKSFAKERIKSLLAKAIMTPAQVPIMLLSVRNLDIFCLNCDMCIFVFVSLYNNTTKKISLFLDLRGKGEGRRGRGRVTSLEHVCGTIYWMVRQTSKIIFVHFVA